MTRKSVVIVGSGNLATCLALALKESEYKITQVYSPDIEHSRTLAETVESHFTTEIRSVKNDSDIYILCVPDSVISQVSKNLPFEGKIVIHTAGSVSIEAIDKKNKAGILWPVFSFNKNHCPENWKKIPCFIEGRDSYTLDIIETLANSISNEVHKASSETRKNLHMTAVFLNNFINHLIKVSFKLNENKVGSEYFEGFITQTIQAAFKYGPENTQTGPAIRKDVQTLKGHLEVLKSNPEAFEIYKLFSEQISGLKLH